MNFVCVTKSARGGAGDVAGGHWRLMSKHFFNHRGAKLTAVDFHPETCMLVAGFTNGIFQLYEVRFLLASLVIRFFFPPASRSPPLLSPTLIVLFD